MTRVLTESLAWLLMAVLVTFVFLGSFAVIRMFFG
jgi:hypothetical protein